MMTLIQLLAVLALVAVDVQAFSLTWDVSMGEYTVLSAGPMVIHNHVFVCDTNGTLYSLDRDTGKLQWKWNSTYFEDMIVWVVEGDGDKTVIVGTSQVTVSLSTSSGKEIWNSQLSSNGITPVVSGGMLFYGTNFDTPTALNVKTGNVTWQSDLLVYFTPIVSMDSVIFAGFQHIYVLDRTTGSRKHTFATNGEAQPYVIGDNVLIHTGIDGAHVFAHDINSGELLWKKLPFNTGIEYDIQLLVADGVVFCNNGQDTVVAMDGMSGIRLWKMKNSNLTTFRASFEQDNILLAETMGYSGNSNITALDVATGQQLWTIAPPFSPGISYLYVAGAYLVVINLQGFVIFRLIDGKYLYRNYDWPGIIDIVVSTGPKGESLYFYYNVSYVASLMV